MPGGFSFGGDVAGGGGRRHHHHPHHMMLHSGSVSGAAPSAVAAGPVGAGGIQSAAAPTFVWDLLPNSPRSAGATSPSVGGEGGGGGGEVGGGAVAATAAAGIAAKRPQQQQQPRLMSQVEAAAMQEQYRRKVKDGDEKYELVASFALSSGRIISYYPHRTRLPFQLTERRKRLLSQYYSNGEQYVALYVNQSDFEHYMPLNCRQLQQQHSASSRQQGKASTRAGNGGGNGGGGGGISGSRSANGLRSLLGIR